MRSRSSVTTNYRFYWRRKNTGLNATEIFSSTLHNAIDHFLFCRTSARPRASEEDPLDLFFRNITGMMRQFSRTDVAELKLQIYNLVAEKEIALNQKLPVDFQYVIALDSEQSNNMVPVEVQRVEVTTPNEQCGNNVVSHQFLKLTQ